MRQSSTKTKLMNILIGFTKGDNHWPAPLKQAGYEVESIGPPLVNSQDEEIRPDLLLSSSFSQHVLVGLVESEEIKVEEITSAQEIEPPSLRMSVEGLDLSTLTNENLIAGTTDTKELVERESLNDGALVFEGAHYQRLNDFVDDALNTNLKSGKLPNIYHPTNYYPFAPEENRAKIAKYIGRELARIAANDEKNIDDVDAEELIVESLDDLDWDTLSDAEKQELVRKGEDVLELFEEKNLSNNLAKLRNRDHHVSSAKAAKRKIEEVIKQLSGSDSSLDDFFDI